MPQELFSKIENGTACCYLRLWPEDLKMWNFMAQGQGLFNTHLLFKAAARPHFDYFFERIDYLGLESIADLDLADDVEFKTRLFNKRAAFILPEEISLGLKTALKDKNLNCVIISDGSKPKAPFFSSPIINIRGTELFGNVEPVWLNLKKRLPKQIDLFFLALGEPKFLIGPRLKLEFNKPVIDIRQSQNLSPSGSFGWLKGMLKK
jgi:hypothetical protein